ncbi:MAG: hypothetical protein H6Q73_2552 [Firmicutes bacterium]|nr:hypothetical protein [Bacillota bacterium]
MAAPEECIMRTRDNKRRRKSGTGAYVRYPDKETGGLVIGNQTFYGVISIDGELTCARCRVVNPDTQSMARGEDRDIFRCACGNPIVVEMPKYEGRVEQMNKQIHQHELTESLGKPIYVQIHQPGEGMSQELDFSKYLNLKGKDRLPDDDDDF